MYQYVKNQFSLQYKATIGADFLTKLLQKDDKQIQLQLWDTAGAEKYNSMGSSFYRNSEACILVFDLTNQESFKNIETWRNEFLNVLNPPDADVYPFILVGNKSDMKEEISVKNEDIESYCKAHNNMPYYPASAKEDINLEEAFNKIGDLAYLRNSKNEESFVPTNKFLKITQEEPKKTRKCC